jgi:hypothetical protein
MMYEGVCVNMHYCSNAVSHFMCGYSVILLEEVCISEACTLEFAVVNKQ